MTSERLTADQPSLETSALTSLKRSVAPAAYLIAAGAATIGWFYVLGRGAWTLIGWAFG